MTDKIAANKGTSSICEYSNSFDTSSSSSCANAINIDSNVLQFSKLNGDSGEESGTNSGTNDKKSFHITSVTVQHNSTDGNADESADESRTEELSDNVDSMSAVDYVQTDVATDLNSLDNKFGKDDVTYKVTSVGSAPIIPTSAQYGIAVVSGVNSGELSEVKKFIPSDCKFSDTVTRTELIANGLENNCANVVAKELNTQIKNERFKVVKIESNEPFKRGRWVCMDFSDQSMDQVKKSAISISTENDKCAKKETSDKEISPSEILVNGTLMENILNDNESKVAGAAPQNSQVADSTYHNGDMSGMNSVSPNQTYNAPFIPSNSNVNQPQAQSLTHIIIAPSTQSQVASGSYGHSQSLPLNELQHVPQAAAAAPQQQQQQSIHLVSSLQQSFHTQSPPQQQQSQQHSSIPHPQAVISQQNMQHMSTVQSPSQQLQQQQSDNNVYNQQQQQQQSTPSAAMSVQQQQLPLLQQQYQPMQQNAPLNQTSAATQCNQRTATGSQTQQQMNMTQNGGETLISVNQSMPSQSQQFPQQTQGHQGQTAAMQQTVQHTMQQVPMQQQSFQHAIPPQQQPSQQQQQPILHQQQQPVQTMPPTQHHSPQQTNQPSVQSMPTQQQIPQQTSGAQANSQPSLQPNNLQQPVLQQGVVQQPKVGQPSAPVQYLPQQAAIQQSSQQPTASQTILNAPQQQAPPQVMQQQMPTGVDQLHIHQMQQQSQQQQQILSQQIPQQQPSQQISHIPQPTPQIPQQQSQQVPMQQPQIPQSMPSHHQPILQSIAQQQPQQMMQTQNMAQSGPPQTTSFQNVPPQQQQQQQQQQPPQQTQPSQQAAQVMQQMQPTMQQMQPPPQQQQPIQSTQSIQHSFPQQQQPPQQMTPMNGGQQTMQAAYQTSVAHQNVSNQMADQNIPVSGSQVTYQQQQQHDVVMSNVSQQQSGDVLMSNVQSQYSLNQPQNIPVQTQLPLHVSLHQPYQNTPSSSYVNASTMNMLGNTSISQQTPPISQPQYYSHSGTSGSITSQDLQQLCGHQHHQPTMAHTSLAGHPNAVSSLATPLISTVTSQTLPPNMDYMVNTASVPAQQNGAAAVIAGQIPYSVHYQNGSSVGSSSNVQTQTTPISQSCSSTGSGGVPLQQYIQQGAPSILSAGAAQVPVSTSYSANISVVHPIQIQQRYVHNNMPAANQMYPTGQPTSFAETSINAENFQHNAYLPEQVVVEIKQDEGLRQDDSDNTAGSSNAVAIDNKIEQAMDLVKSHLMFAVREEVEVLKEKISELMDKINQLEIENSILKANASQETLAQLPPTHSSAPSTAAVSNTTSNTTQASIGPTNGQPP